VTYSGGIGQQLQTGNKNVTCRQQLNISSGSKAETRNVTAAIRLYVILDCCLSYYSDRLASWFRPILKANSNVKEHV